MNMLAAVASLTDLFRRSMERHPDRPAVSDDRRTLTYAELDQASDRVCALLRSRGVTTEDRVGLYVERSVDLFAGIVGILKSGAAYVAIDTRYPDARRHLMLSRSGARVVITEPGWEDRLGGLQADIVHIGDDVGTDLRSDDVVVPPSSAACVLFTSGSLGEPKAIVLEHRNLVSFACNPSLPALGPDDRTGQISSVSFDTFHFEIWNTLAAGARTVVLPLVPDLLAAGFRGEMRRYGITAMLAPTMVINHVVRDDPDAFSPLRVLQAGGDVLLPSACRDLLAGQFRGSLYNLYGPAEITTACTAHLVSREDAESPVIPIGRPLDGVSVQVLTPELRPVDTGEVGELFVGGRGVARGYQGRPDLTAERFLALPSNGGGVRMYRTGDLVRRREDDVLEFVGRVDNQVKIRGYRVEPGEVERALRRDARVHDAVVLPDGGGSDRRLVAFVVVDAPASAGELRERAGEHLPHFMVPNAFITVSQIPANAHGKRDADALRAILTQLADHGRAHGSPATDTERYLAALWAELLKRESIGREDDFFGLGGHSLLAFRMNHRLNRELGVAITSAVVLENTVLKDLAVAIDASRAHPRSPDGTAGVELLDA